MPDAHIESKGYIVVGSQHIPVQIEYAPVVYDPPIPSDLFTRSLADLRNTTFQASGSLTLAGIEVFIDQLFDHTPADSPIFFYVTARQHNRLSHLEALARRYHRSKLRKRRKHRAMFRRKKRGLA